MDHTPAMFNVESPALARDEALLREGPANLQRGRENVGGKLFLTNQRLIFRPHGANIQRAELEIPLVTVGQLVLRWTKFLGAIPVFPNALAVISVDGKEACFTVSGRDAWRKDLFHAAEAAHARAAGDGPTNDHAEAVMRDQDEAAVFITALHARWSTPWVTRAILAANVAVFALMVLMGVHLTKPASQDLIRWGANFAPMTLDGQLWRLLSAAFLHFGLLHIALNMWVLNDVGPLLERLLGPVAFAGLYLAAAVGGSAASVWFSTVGAVSAGASGAIFGLFGALLAFVLISKVLPRRVLDPLRNSTAAFVGINLVFGLVLNKTGIVGVDMAAHLGGLLVGFAIGALMAWRFDLRLLLENRLMPVKTLVALAVAAALVAVASQAPNPLGEYQRALVNLGKVEKQVFALLKQAGDDKLGDEDSADILEQKVLPAWKAAVAQVKSNERLPKALRKRVEILRRLGRLRTEGWTLMAQALRKKDLTLMGRAKAKLDEAVKELEAMAKKRAKGKPKGKTEVPKR